MSKVGSFERTTTNKDELGFQKELIDSAKAIGGYGRKVSHPQIKGIADLILQFRNYSMVQVECKDLGVKTVGFNVQSDITQHQKDHIDALNRAAGYRVAFYAIKVVIANTATAIFLPEYQERISYADLWGITAEQKGKHWPDLEMVWQRIGVPRLDDSKLNAERPRS